MLCKVYLLYYVNKHQENFFLNKYMWVHAQISKL